MNSIAFIDTEIDTVGNKILDIGGIKPDGSRFHRNSVTGLIQFLDGVEFICGHNIINHDLVFLNSVLINAGIDASNAIDTLFLSPLLFPKLPYHALVKDDKLQSEEINNPLNDSIKGKDLFYDEVAAFSQLSDSLKQIYYLLLKDKKEFSAFFRYVSCINSSSNAEELIRQHFKAEICMNSNLAKIIADYPVELAYCLSLINTGSRYSITPRWVLKNFPEVERIMLLLRNKPCISGCKYCNMAFDVHLGLKKFFGFDAFRTYAGEPLQEEAVKAAVENKSILVIFPTGGGKSITFQIPALMSGESSRGLTVIISPLQSLMKDQVDNLEKAGITDAVTINGLLDPIERAKSFERVEDGSASILYISPESLRSRTIERLILGRKIIRFVIDEAHCFSSWGQDFRVDYLYIGDFIRMVQEKKNLTDQIPVSCFTATAKKKVIEDIRNYFREKLSLDLEVFSSRASRTNLRYKVFEKGNEEEKYQAVRDLLEEKNCPAIIYVSRTQKAYQLAIRLSKDGFNALPYHGKMDTREKTSNQNAFINGEVPVMVATSAFGMGVDKKDVGMVIHYEISDSLENYVQEAGRAGRDETLVANCYVLFNEEDLSKHFILLNQTKLSIREIQQVWKAIKEITRFRATVSNSALEIARKAGWDDSVAEIETRVTTAIAALENAGYLKRGQNIPRIFANSILSKNAQEAIDRINSSDKFEERQKEKGIRIIRKLFSVKNRKQSTDEIAETRIDYISDHLGIVKAEVINIVNLLREEKILADAKDLTAFIRKGERLKSSVSVVETYCSIEKFLLPYIGEQEKTFHIKELNEEAGKNGCEMVTPNQIKTIINFWAIKNWIKKHNLQNSKNHIVISGIQPKEVLKEKLEQRHELAGFIIEYLYYKSNLLIQEKDNGNDEIMVDFSVHELKDAWEISIASYGKKVSVDDIEDTLFYLSRIDAIKIEGGFLVIYNSLTIERTEPDKKKQYKMEDYQNLNQFYQNKIQQIHIVGEYAKKMITDYKDALQFVEDYFQMNYSSFLIKYFKGSRQDEIKRNLTPAKFRQLFGELSPAQLKIINDSKSKYIVVAAGPGSGKTRVLVHKLASLLLIEDVKHEQLLMLTFSRAAATEFKKRLLKLIGNAAHYIEIKTFHSYCFDLLGKVGSIEKSGLILKDTIAKIRNREVEANRITRTVLVIDEAQDMNEDEFNLVKALMDQNEEMRVIAVGDDDQNIYEFRGASSKYLKQLIDFYNAEKYELVENYRSKSNLVEFTNQFAECINQRLKNTPVISHLTGSGRISLVQYHSGNLIAPLVNDILITGISGTACVLTKTNEEALQITGLLLKNGLQAKLIQTNDSFSLYNLVEIRYFIDQLKLTEGVFLINDDTWTYAKRKLVNAYHKSIRLEVCINMIKEFEAANPKKKYKSDLEAFIFESKLEDFYSEAGETIFVSTIHKAKGKEFENVFLMLENFNAETDQAKRQLYVAMTRAKSNLTIHTNSNFLNKIKVENLELTVIKEAFPPPGELVILLSFRDVWLDYFAYCQNRISMLRAGELLKLTEDGCLDSAGHPVLKFSMQCINQIKTLNQSGYILKNARLNFMVYWQKEDSKQKIIIILPELHFEKQQPERTD